MKELSLTELEEQLEEPLGSNIERTKRVLELLERLEKAFHPNGCDEPYEETDSLEDAIDLLKDHLFLLQLWKQ